MSYFVYKTHIWPLPIALSRVKKDILEFFRPPTHESSDYKNWIAQLDLKTCFVCRSHHGKIYKKDEMPDDEPPVHNNCRCEMKNIEAAFAGTATQDGMNGADIAVKNTGKLPPNYITKKQAINLGWISWQGNLNKVAPGKSIGGEVYQNRNGHLPQEFGRVWYEADINYDNGLRNSQRLLFSNDGLIFATYDHYMTFVQIQ
ncbi:ribonuclease [Caprobacter fermentans]|uniref:Ribonuclease n=2 Tax=Caproicibacter fermentans TaxID=2576756 RepID=A0A6N8HUI9_9FIRM|nr:ribonuclease domain-containing protein [Caproicibacter fermentans]MVB09461.1 ribonuclease [Caproicibacter fermentans]